jgi:D-alanyl-D-alanine carboxypeptidase
MVPAPLRRPSDLKRCPMGSSLGRFEEYHRKMGNDRLHAAIMQNENTVRVLGSASTLFPWWSFTKCALAICALRLSEEGFINLEECRPGKPYTLRQLLQHRAGVPEYGKLHSYHEAVARHDAPWSRAKLLEEVQADQLDFEPGTSWSYSNVGYLFVRDAIEQAAGIDLGTALKQFITDPLELRSVRLAMSSSDFDSVYRGTSELYDPGWVCHGCLLGTSPDAARLLYALLHGRLLKPATLQSMLETYHLGGPIPGRPRDRLRIWTGIDVRTGGRGGPRHRPLGRRPVLRQCCLLLS